MLKLLGVGVPDPDAGPPPSFTPPENPTRATGSTSPGADGSSSAAEHKHRTPRRTPGSGMTAPKPRSPPAGALYLPAEFDRSARPPTTGTARMRFHFFSFQIFGTTGYMGHA